MIERLNLYHATCDKCKTTRFTTVAEYHTLERRMREEGWWVMGHECRCPKCCAGVRV
jgi:hypothetical protein